MGVLLLWWLRTRVALTAARPSCWVADGETSRKSWRWRPPGGPPEAVPNGHRRGPEPGYGKCSTKRRSWRRLRHS